MLGGRRDAGNLRRMLALCSYRPWQPVYRGWVNALKRNADYSPAGRGGEKTHISYAMRVAAVPAFVVSPDAVSDVASVGAYKALAANEPQSSKAPIFGVADGIVPDRNAKVQAGPNAVILPPSAGAAGSGR